jgi:hypothetical protein
MLICLAAIAISQDARSGEIFEAGGYTFSDELGGFVILSVHGAGTEDDPIVVVQKITEVGPAVLVIRPASGQADWVDFRYTPFMQLSLVSVITNESRRVWAGFDLELQEELGQPSVYRDGLSFDQLHTFAERLFSSDKFAVFTDLTEPYDRIRFEQGKVDHGETAQFQMFITDVTPKEQFYLLQEPHLLVASGPRDTTMQFASQALFPTAE